MDETIEYDAKIALITELIETWQIRKFKLQVLKAFTLFDVNHKGITYIHVTPENEVIMDMMVKEQILTGKVKELNVNYNAILKGEGIYRAFADTLFGRKIVWDAERLMAT